MLLINKHKYSEALIIYKKYIFLEKFIQRILRSFDWFDEKVQEIHSNLPFIDKEILN